MNKERAGSLFFLFAGIYGFVLSVQIPIGRLNEPGPGILPLCLSILLIISGISWLILGKGKDGEGARMDLREIRKLETPLRIVVLSTAFILTFTLLGYLVAATLYLLLTFLWISRFKFWVAISLAVCIGGGSWYFFGKVLSVQLPKGLLPL